MTLTDEERRVLEYVHTKPEERGRILEILGLSPKEGAGL